MNRPEDDELPSDAAFTQFIATFQASRLSADEWLLFQFYRLRSA